MRIIFERPVLEKLHQAAFAAHPSNHLDGLARRALVDQLGDRVAPDVYGRTEPRSDPRAFANHDDGPRPHHSEPNNSTPMVTASAGDAS